MIVVGGAYIEECDWPEWKRLMGPGVRAALAAGELSKGSELYTYCHADSLADLQLTMSAAGIRAHVRATTDLIKFFYKHPLTSPPDREPIELRNENAEPWVVSGKTVLAFGLLEAGTTVNAERAIFEWSQVDYALTRGEIGSLALIVAEKDLPNGFVLDDNDRDAAADFMTAWSADIMIVRRQAGGAVLFRGEERINVSAYAASEWFKIGAGNVFCAMFAHYWGELQLDPAQAADLASGCSAFYASTRSLPMVSDAMVPQTETYNPAANCKIFVASPCDSMAQQWLLDQAIMSLEALGVQTVSPYDLGLDGVAVENDDIAATLSDCNAVLVLAEGADLASMLAVGLAHVRDLPIVILAEETKQYRLKLWEGTNCEVARDFASAVYRAMVAARRNATK
jgi:hypothetical protein